MINQNQRVNYRYRCKINEVQYDIQLYNIQQEKIKMMINTKNPYTDDYIEYSNIYSLVQFQEITRYYNLFENINEIFEDLARTIQEKNFTITRNGNTLTLTLKIIINKNIKDINFILDKNKIIDLSSQKDYQVYSNTASLNSEIKQIKHINLEKSRRNIDISSIGELNNLLSDLKDRITVLETSQNNQYFQKNEEPTLAKTYTNPMSENLLNNYNIAAGLENILIRLNRLETENNNKDQTIEKLEKKLKYYESLDTNYTQKDNNIYRNYTTPTYSNYMPRTQASISPYYNYQLQTQALNSFTIGKRHKGNPYINRSEIYIEDNRNKSYDARLKQSRSQALNNNYYNNDNYSFNTKETKNSNNYNRSNSYIDRNRSYRNNIKNRQYNEKDTEKSSVYLKSNSSISNYSNNREKLAIPIVPRQDLKKYVNSRIIFTKAELRLLKTKLSGGDKHIHVFFDLLYRASLDGDYEEIIKENTYDAEKTLTLFYTYEGSRFGVYVQKRKATTFLKGKTYKEVPGTSFIVSLNNLRFFNISPNQTSKGGHEDDLCFGRTFYLNRNGSNWLIYTPKSNFLKKRCFIGNQKGEYIKFDPEILIGNKNDYHIKDIEIFHVVFEKDENNEKDNDKKKYAK